MSNAVALLKNRNTYFMAQNILKEYEVEIEDAKKYYSSIFTNSIDDVLKIQMKSISSKAKIIDSCVNRIVNFNQYVYLHMPEDYGIFEGKSAVLIWWYHYAKYTGDNSWMKKAEELLCTIKKAISNEELSWNFENGKCGVGWAIIYLYSQGFITEEPREVIRIVDESIKTIDLDECQDYSFATGAGGLFAYLSLRTMNNNFFTSEYKDKLQQLALSSGVAYLTDYDRYSYKTMNTEEVVWNATLSRGFFHGNMTLSIDGFDILGQLSNVRQTLNAQGRTETWFNSIPRYVMFRVIYRLNKEPKKEIL